ncbi:hypothetical protein PR048_020687 [Dryococelus australis]|uniref:Uncharacterized protein n=1 Tax=Dryococelus australis TaxID=614101 RepID=A0ABQ9H716_9NEOP|nr:hypothetical protein PR048_020687 [Dryococelus australis]
MCLEDAFRTAVAELSGSVVYLHTNTVEHMCLEGAFRTAVAELSGSVVYLHTNTVEHMCLEGRHCHDIKCAIATKRKALNWRAVFSSHCVALSAATLYYFIGGKSAERRQLEDTGNEIMTQTDKRLQIVYLNLAIDKTKIVYLNLAIDKTKIVYLNLVIDKTKIVYLNLAIDTIKLVYLNLAIDKTKIVYLNLVIDKTKIVYLNLVIDKTKIVYLNLAIDKTKIVYLNLAIDKTKTITLKGYLRPYREARAANQRVGTPTKKGTATPFRLCVGTCLLYVRAQIFVARGIHVAKDDDGRKTSLQFTQSSAALQTGQRTAFARTQFNDTILHKNNLLLAITNTLIMSLFLFVDLPWRSRLVRRRPAMWEALGSNPTQSMGVSLTYAIDLKTTWLPKRERQRERERERERGGGKSEHHCALSFSHSLPRVGTAESTLRDVITFCRHYDISTQRFTRYWTSPGPASLDSPRAALPTPENKSKNTHLAGARDLLLAKHYITARLQNTELLMVWKNWPHMDHCSDNVNVARYTLLISSPILRRQLCPMQDLLHHHERTAVTLWRTASALPSFDQMSSANCWQATCGPATSHNTAIVHFTVTQGLGKREIPEKTRRLSASSGTIPTYENPGATPPGIKACSFWRETSNLTTTPPRPLGVWRMAVKHANRDATSLPTCPVGVVT